MNISNRFYGQNAVMAMYCGLSIPPPPIWGFLQHAWMPDSPVLSSESLSTRWPTLVYNARNRDEMIRMQLASPEMVIAIGSPFLYLLSVLGIDDAGERPLPSSTIFYPVHGWGDDEDIARHESLVAEMESLEGTGLSVCLHWFDHANLAIRHAYERRGYRVITHGWGGSPWFYVRQISELLRHGTVWSDSASTAMWHGGALGLRMQLRSIGMRRADDPQFAIDEWERRWPALYSDGATGSAAIGMARFELGADHLLEPEALAETLGWRGPNRRKVAMAAPVVKLRRWLQDLDRAQNDGGWAR